LTLRREERGERREERGEKYYQTLRKENIAEKLQQVALPRICSPYNS